MLGLIPLLPANRPLRVLCLGAHCDDIEIGCGGTLLALQGAGLELCIDWVVLSGDVQRRAETARAMGCLLPGDVRGELLHGNFADGSMPGQYGEVKAFFESLKTRPLPDLVFTHERDDRHQDHRVVNEMTWNTFRDQLVLEYEIPKWDGGLGQPNLYVPIGRKHGQEKIAVLLESYVSQSGRDWFSRDTFEAILRLRGMECRAPGGWAEAFHARKLHFLLR
jgi:LmbE family N-acetylglucosaminyl deacetylase